MRSVNLSFILTLTAVAGFGQSQLGAGAVCGVVQDSSGSVVTDAHVTVTNVETGLVRDMVSGAGGQFVAPVLPIGNYKLRITKPGFSTLEQTDIIVNVGGAATVTAVLKVGGVSETITVEDTA